MFEIDVKKLAKQNPLVDERKVRDAYAVLSELDKVGIADHEYSIVPPFSVRRNALGRVANS